MTTPLTPEQRAFVYHPPLHEITTETLATQCGVLPQSIRVRLCRSGSYFGVKPRKLANGRLMWPDDTRERITVS